MDPDEMINIPKLLFTGGLVKTVAEGTTAVSHGRVRIQQWCIGIPEVELPRWVLRGVALSIGERSMMISEDGTKIMRHVAATL